MGFAVDSSSGLCAVRTLPTDLTGAGAGRSPCASPAGALAQRRAGRPPHLGPHVRTAAAAAGADTGPSGSETRSLLGTSHPYRLGPQDAGGETWQRRPGPGSLGCSPQSLTLKASIKSLLAALGEMGSLRGSEARGGSVA